MTGRNKKWDKMFAHLNQEEERRLACLAGKGDKEATDRLVTSHINYVIKIARGYRRSGVPMSDLIQEGMVGLMQAVKRFNPDKDVRLSTYAMWWIRASIQDHVVRSWSLVRLSTTSAQKSLFLNLRRMTSDLLEGADALSDDLSSKLAERFETTAADVKSLARRITQRDQSLNAKITEYGNESWLDQLVSDHPTPEDSLAFESERRDIRELIAKALAALPAREEFIIRSRYLTEAKRTFAALARDLDLSKDRVRQLEVRALAKLRDFLEPMRAHQQSLSE
ncbi:MAG: RNA polymerase factor sigma-32 [Rhodospirillaceae bacterium]|jgi:RNA polymerase sigma-32 factor|nr:RNA polymerase factor sigma-32 [Rhodospirillaceae bacterium]